MAWILSPTDSGLQQPTAAPPLHVPPTAPWRGSEHRSRADRWADTHKSSWATVCPSPKSSFSWNANASRPSVHPGRQDGTPALISPQDLTELQEARKGAGREGRRSHARPEQDHAKTTALGIPHYTNHAFLCFCIVEALTSWASSIPTDIKRLTSCGCGAFHMQNQPTQNLTTTS